VSSLISFGFLYREKVANFVRSFFSESIRVAKAVAHKANEFLALLIVHLSPRAARVG
tara:strand:- start:234 stop:404 length:171 start_codon:yes stop_codon:yes gene_type:complete